MLKTILLGVNIYIYIYKFSQSRVFLIALYLYAGRHIIKINTQSPRIQKGMAVF